MVNITSVEWDPPCGCIIFYEYDNDLPPDQRLHTCIAVARRCVQHPQNANVSLQQHHDSVLAEHQKFGWSLGLALDNLTAQLGQTDPVSGALTLKQGITFNYSFSGAFPNRVCTISFTGVTLTNQQKNTLQTKANQLFGTGKVVVA